MTVLTVLTVMAVLAASAVLVMTAAPLKLDPKDLAVLKALREVNSLRVAREALRVIFILQGYFWRPPENSLKNKHKMTFLRLFFDCGNISANFSEISQTFHRISAPVADALKRFVFGADFHEVAAEFLQTFHKNPFANDPISELPIF